MCKCDGELIPVSHLLGSDYIPVFLQRYCIPDFGTTGQFGVPDPVFVSGGSVLNSSALQIPSTSEEPNRMPRISTGYYYPRYLLDARVAVHPLAYTRIIPGEGPYVLSNMWGSNKFHYSSL